VATAGNEVFALTDEQIVGLTPEVTSDEWPLDARGKRVASKDPGGPAGAKVTGSAAREEKSRQDAGATTPVGVGEIPRSGESARNDVVAAAPQWLAERMNDPWCGEEAKEFWEGKQRAESEAAAYRELFATPEDARALKEIYPGGISEAKSAAERARALDEIDAAFYRGDAAARMQLAQRMMAQDPAAFREMVEAGVRLLGGRQGDQRLTISEREEKSRSLAGARDDNGVSGGQEAGRSKDRPLHEDAQAGVPVPREVAQAYGEFERTANAELEKSVGGAIARAMEQALPNLGAMKAQGAQRDGETAPLQERLAGAVREEVEAGLKSDRQLGEQVARVLAGRRFDKDARAQVVRLIGARAQQLVPGAVKRVVSSWTSATLAAKGKEAPVRAENTESTRRAATPASRTETEGASAARASSRGRRLDYGRMSDEEIVGL